MKMFNNKSSKIIACILAAALLCGGSAALAYNAGSKSTTDQSDKTETSNKSSDSAISLLTNTDNELYKDETVYVIAGADGSTQKVIVSDWIKNGTGAASITDKSELENIKNVKGDETYTIDKNNMCVWDAQGNDIYYQGTTDKDLPVDIALTYTLDGTQISPDDLAGKSGKVSIRFDYTNTQYEYVEVDGVKTKIYVPFTVLTGMILDNEHFKNITVSNGKIVNDGDRSVVVGFAMPGLQESLDLDKDTFEIPDYVEITADVEDFELTTTLSYTSNELLNAVDLSDISSLDELESKLDTLTSSMNALVDGSSELYGYLTQLLDKSGELIAGINKLASGAQQLSTGASDVNGYVNELSAGLKKIISNNETLTDGAEEVFESLLNQANTQLSAAGLSVPTLTIENYDAVLDGVLANLDETAVYNTAYNTALSQVTEGVRANEDTIKAGVTASVKKTVLEGILAASGITNTDGTAMTQEQYEAAVSAGLIDSNTAAAISAALEAKMSSEDIQNTISQYTEAKVQALITEKMASDEITSKINAAVEAAKKGSGTIQSLKDSLDDYNKFYQGIIDYTDGVSYVYSKSAEIAAGTETLSAKMSELAGGLDTLQSSSGALVSGVKDITDGAMTLSEGLEKFKTEGVDKIVDALNGDIGSLVSRLQAIKDVSEDYNSFSGISDSMKGEVKFIYKTASIEG